MSIKTHDSIVVNKTNKIRKAVTSFIAFSILLAPLAAASPAAALASTTGTYDSVSTEIAYTDGNWSTTNSGSDTGGSSQLATTGSAKASFTFKGKAIKWISRLSASSGIADVYIDNIKVATVDRYFNGNSYKQTVFETSTLTDNIHTIQVVRTGKKNPAATGSNLLVDAFIVPDVDPPTAPTGTKIVFGKPPYLTWNASSSTDVNHYRIYRLNSNDTAETLVGQTDPNTRKFDLLGLNSSTEYRYSVTAVDDWGNESKLSYRGFFTSSTTQPADYQRASKCPTTPTVTVATRVDLQNAVAAAAPGAVIKVADGVYGTWMTKLTGNGTVDKPVWICGSRNVIFDGLDYKEDRSVLIRDSSYLIFTGMTIRNNFKGIALENSHHITISDLLVENIGYEAIHLRKKSSDNYIVGNTIRNTGKSDPFYGEGIYIGSSNANWCTYTECNPDTSDRNAIIANNISMTGSDPIELKEGTTGAIVKDNNINGTGAMTRAEAWVKVAGNNNTILNNIANQSTYNGYRVQGYNDGWGNNNLFAENSGNVNAAGYEYEVYEPKGLNSTHTIISCDENVYGAALGMSNIACVPMP